MTSNEKRSRVPAVPAALPGDQPVLAEVARLLVDRARGDGIALTGDGGLLPALVAQILQTGLNVELGEHLGYEPYAPEGRGSGNSRNGSYAKTVITDVGPVEVQMPRDRTSSFEPVTVPKHARRLDGLTAQVVSLYAKGMTTGDIQAHLEEIYSTEISRETISGNVCWKLATSSRPSLPAFRHSACGRPLGLRWRTPVGSLCGTHLDCPRSIGCDTAR